MTGKLLLAVAVLLKIVDAEIKTEENVLVLTKDNFASAIADNPFLLVEFYAPWCGHCKALAPEYAKAAGILNEKHPDIKLGKVDATEETQLAEEYNIRGYPTLQFFRNGNSIEYTGGRTSDEIVNWLVKRTGPVAKAITSSDELSKFKEENEVVVVGFFDDDQSEASKNFFSVASSFDSVPFGVVTDASLISELGYKDDNIVAFKKFEDEPAVFKGNDDASVLKKFVASESLPLIVEFNAETSKKIFNGDIKSHLLIFLSRKAGHFDKIMEEAKPAAKEFRHDLLFVAFDSDEPEHMRILEYFGIDESDIPAMRVIKMEDEMIKYKPQTEDLTAESISQFAKDYLAGKVSVHLLSQKLPEDWNKGPVTVLVSTNFDEVAFDKSKNVLVEFYAPWCGHCKQLTPLYEKVGEHFKADDDVVIAKMDATANEMEHIKIGNYPTIKLFTKGDNKVIDYKGERTVDAMIKFVESGGQEVDGPNVQKEEDEDDDAPRKDEL